MASSSLAQRPSASGPRHVMADAAHELRTPITVLRTRAEVALQQAREPANYVSALRGVEAEARRLGGIVDSLLVLARGCDDFVLREQLTNVASDWVARARAVKARPKAAYGPSTERDVS